MIEEPTSYNIELKDDLTRITRHRTRFVVARHADIQAKIGQVYRAEGELDDLSSDLLSVDDPGPAMAEIPVIVRRMWRGARSPA